MATEHPQTTDEQRDTLQNISDNDESAIGMMMTTTTTGAASRSTAGSA